MIRILLILPRILHTQSQYRIQLRYKNQLRILLFHLRMIQQEQIVEILAQFLIQLWMTREQSLSILPLMVVQFPVVQMLCNNVK